MTVEEVKAEVSPSHYKHGSKEVWEMMIDVFGKEKWLAFCELNAFKYRMRAGRKDKASCESDLEKAFWYEDKLAKDQSDLLIDNLV